MSALEGKKLSSLQIVSPPAKAASGPAVEVPEELEHAGKATLAISGMWCTSCANAVESVLAKQRGVSSAAVSFASETARVLWNPAQTSLSEIIRGAQKLGYGILPVARADTQYQNISKEVKALKRRLALSAFFTVSTMAAMQLLHNAAGRVGAGGQRVLYAGMILGALIVVLYGGWLFLKAGWRTLRAGVPGMDFLISLGAAGAFSLSVWNLLRGSSALYFDSATMLITLLLAGRLIEHAARKKSRSVIQTLLSEAPDRASMVREGTRDDRCAVGDIPRGALIRIRPGERISLDGTVHAGESQVDNSLITGESAPVFVGPGSLVLAGAINTDGELIVKVERTKGERRIDQISARMETMLGSKSRYETVAAFFARKLVPAVIVIAVAAGVCVFFSSGSLEKSILRALVVLVITCPCALGLATPMALLVALGRGARQGIVYRDGETLEQLARVDTVFFDKTGTLTEGKPFVVSVTAAPGVSPNEVLAAAACAEWGSEHPLARAIREKAGQFSPADGTSKAIPGKGVEWQAASGETIVVGSRGLLEERGIECREEPAGPGSSVYVAKDRRCIGRIIIDDALRTDARETVTRLKEGKFAVSMLTGDEEAAAWRVGSETGLAADEIYARVSPEKKEEIISERQSSGRVVAYVGEGLNDGPALSAAQAGIAVQGACDLALAAAPVVLQRGGIAGVWEAIRIARKAKSIMRQNLFLGVVYNFIAIPVAALGYATPMIAAAAMVLSSLCVTLNSLRLMATRS